MLGDMVWLRLAYRPIWAQSGCVKGVVRKQDGCLVKEIVHIKVQII